MRYEKLELIRQFLHRKPFRPFRVVMRSGARHEIVDRDKVAIGQSRAYAFLPRMAELPDSEIELVYEPWSSRNVP
jgi:hypothetical protein